MNLASRRCYRGLNVFLLSAMGFESHYWLTYKQAQERDGNVRKGERSTPVVFWKTWERNEIDDAGEVCKRRVPVLCYYNVFNVAQCDGIEVPPALPLSRPFAPLAECERIIAGMPNRPTIQHREAQLLTEIADSDPDAVVDAGLDSLIPLSTRITGRFRMMLTRKLAAGDSQMLDGRERECP